MKLSVSATAAAILALDASSIAVVAQQQQQQPETGNTGNWLADWLAADPTTGCVEGGASGGGSFGGLSKNDDAINITTTENNNYKNRNSTEVVAYNDSFVRFTVNDKDVDVGKNVQLEVNGDYKFGIVLDGLFKVLAGEDVFVGALLRIQQGDETIVLQPAESSSSSPEEVEATLASWCPAPAVGLVGASSSPLTEPTAAAGTEQQQPWFALIGLVALSNSTTDDVVVDITVVWTTSTNTDPTTTEDANATTTNLYYTTHQQFVFAARTAPPTASPTTTMYPSASPAPTFMDVCHVCGDPDLVVTVPNATIAFRGQSFTCEQVELGGLERSIHPDLCLETIVPLVTETCDCQPPPPPAPDTTTTNNNTDADPTDNNSTMGGGGNSTDDDDDPPLVDGNGNETAVDVDNYNNNTIVDGGDNNNTMVDGNNNNNITMTNNNTMAGGDNNNNNTIAKNNTVTDDGGNNSTMEGGGTTNATKDDDSPPAPTRPPSTAADRGAESGAKANSFGMATTPTRLCVALLISFTIPSLVVF